VIDLNSGISANIFSSVSRLNYISMYYFLTLGGVNMKKLTIVILVIATLLVAGALAASASFENTEETPEIKDAPVCGKTACDGECGGQCGVPTCGCKR